MPCMYRCKEWQGLMTKLAETNRVTPLKTCVLPNFLNLRGFESGPPWRLRDSKRTSLEKSRTFMGHQGSVGLTGRRQLLDFTS